MILVWTACGVNKHLSMSGAVRTSRRAEAVIYPVAKRRPSTFLSSTARVVLIIITALALVVVCMYRHCSTRQPVDIDASKVRLM